jgi:hypothetical protein
LPDAEYLERVYKRFSVSPQWLLTGIGEKNPLKKSKDLNPSIEKILEEYRDAGVIPDYSISADEFAIIKILRSLPDINVLEILRILFDKHTNYPPSYSNKYLKKSSRLLSTILNLKKGQFEKGIDIEQKMFVLKMLQDEVSMEMYDLDIKLIDSYNENSDKNKFIEKLKRAAKKTDKSKDL